MEQQSTPWRVFDAPTPADGGAGMPAGTATAPVKPPLTLASPRIALLGLLAAIGIATLAVILALSGSGDASVVGPGVSDAAFGTDGPAVAGQLVVDVTGAVVRPGVYHLAIGARVGDAITAAGGFGPRVDAEVVGATLNLAASLKDGEQVRVPSRDDVAASAGTGGGTSGGGGSGGGSGTLVDINSATEAELDALPGIGPVTAGKIIDARLQSPFKTVDELQSRGLVGQKVFDQIKTLVTVG